MAHLIEYLPLAAPHVYLYPYLSQFLEPLLDYYACRPYHLCQWGTIDDRLDKLLRVVYLICLLRNSTGIWVDFLPVLLEVILTTTRPGTTVEWAINRMRKVRFDVSVSFLRTAECASTNRASM